MIYEQPISLYMDTDGMHINASLLEGWRIGCKIFFNLNSE